jgi:hypothetical protein
MDFKFEINKGLLIYSALLGTKSRNFHSPTIKNKYYDEYLLAHQLFSEPRKVFIDNDYKNSITRAGSDLLSMFSEFEQTEEFKRLLIKTEEYKTWIESQWKLNKTVINNHLKNILNTEIPSESATVFIIKPSIGGGSYLGNYTIYWGHTEDWQNYSLVYLAHEYLHTFIPAGNVEHCIIELATDNELRLRINGKGEYFEENGEKIGHDNLQAFERRLLPRWKQYLKDKEKNIYEFIEDVKNDSPF